MPEPPRILMAAGGTGGHVYPAIAIADAVKRLEPDAAVEFAGTRDRMEWEAVPKAGYAIHPITVSGIQRKLTVRNLTFPFKLAKGFGDSWSLVGDFDPDAVVGTGGYVSGPVLLTASVRGRPVVIQEQNAYAGLTNRLLARLAEHIHIAFPEAKDFVDPEKCVLSGNPTRKELTEADRAQARTYFGIPSDALMLFVFGGSLGSKAINGAMEEHLEALLDNENLHVLWQTGERYYERLEAHVPSHARLHLNKYIDRMDYAYAATDVALCRAGAITCSELMMTGTPAVLVPSPNVTEDHQTKNARSMTNSDAAVMLPEPELNDRLLGAVRDLLDDGDRRRAMSEAAREIARPDAADDIARDVLRLAGLPEYET
ncbi:MAG: undecaprenyldiphospho-muramoylpentapeptide beta-N-acetylglucosaminyltransferase [Bacteroidetes bacterium QS_8_64_10]|nr:MAG: undecaprenyldiphospho-muramoylpentapeptide beta-N-acetylglucosaminyltransferase [Bacteroidetes bacterium QS_8_64_10]